MPACQFWTFIRRKRIPGGAGGGDNKDESKEYDDGHGHRHQLPPPSRPGPMLEDE
ncbi:hypothetical protein BC943DRAFT_357669 [Umbelopsis sp. AD052]|nr:hypothetical protein BC943DRAFT_357669 [Umbelopsis sp. AD052]